MKYSVIDIGSNSVRHLKAEIENNAIEGEKSLIVTRLGEGVDTTKKLTDRAIRDTVEAIKTFKREAEEIGAEDIFLMATSAVRDSTNKETLLERVHAETGLTIEVLSGEEEAIVGCIGVEIGLMSPEAILIIDIGGGSTEFIVFDGEIRHASSANVGAVRMTGKHIFTDPVSQSEKAAIKEDIRTIIRPHIKEVMKHSFVEVIGIGGTATTFGAIDLKMESYDRHKIHNHIVTKECVHTINEKFQNTVLDERKRIPGLAPKRADVIIAGGLILEIILEEVSRETFRVSDFDNLEGYLAQKLMI